MPWKEIAKLWSLASGAKANDAITKNPGDLSAINLNQVSTYAWRNREFEGWCTLMASE